ncbi:glycosyltransferase family 32 protein [Intestinibacter bartlettii]|uniref:glycosyltransferase family 32 protein n=1 Tax=Intestinibacter bartlettii TaxID=261299 RepID=UPI0039A106FD
MKVINCNLEEVHKVIGKNKIVLFGCGSWLGLINHTPIMKYQSKFAYIIDNNPGGTVSIGSSDLAVYSPDKIKGESKCDIIITSPVYMYDMYMQLNQMDLSNEIRCFFFPFMVLETSGNEDGVLLKEVINAHSERKIPKIIHSFWFSGEPKADSYQRCIDSWIKMLPDYEIIEWNMDNYDWHKHPFVKKAVELKAWAFASDYARLDVLNEIGGIYMDADVEVFRKFDDLLGNNAILSFSNCIQIDLAFMASKKNNSLIKNLLDIYNNIEIPYDRKLFTKYFQPALIRETLVENGIRMDGSLQRTKDVTVFPNKFFMPQDFILFRDYDKTQHTYCVHYDNFGWSFSKDNKRNKKIHDNNLLWKLVEKEKICE